MLVIDATVSFDGAFAPVIFERAASRELVGPPLLWSETTAALSQAAFRRSISGEEARAALERFLSAPIERRVPKRLYGTAWAIASDLGWAKTYDAEYVALAQLLDCPLLTKDARLARRVGSMVAILEPTDL